jgi:hypothetical protein
MIYRKRAGISHYHKCNAWGAKSGMLHAHAQLNPINPLQAIYEFAPSIFSILRN